MVTIEIKKCHITKHLYLLFRNTNTLIFAFLQNTLLTPNLQLTYKI
ncbi:hypothetical protein AB406_2190 [Riemerella anatipestifer]|uniref:Uncharacterized protein n=1 Tax=Riemerella anatipestifer TaxID=34085 RepID=A0A1S7DVJ1_RIEAN|nr:hypothetical protein AB406_2190 [Riemerella anatipestifer]